MKQVTLGHEDIEWDRPKSADDWYKSMLTNDEKFLEYVRSCAYLDEALEQSHKFHRLIANQLISAGVGGSPRGQWARRAIFLCNLAKRRRGDMRAIFIRVYGHPAFELELARLDSKYPRAIWGESL